jgi:titin
MRALGVFVVLATAVAGAVVGVSPASASTTISGLTPISYTEGDGPVTVAPNAVITESGSFADGYVEFSIPGATATESLTLPTVSTPDSTDGAVSVVGTAVYLGLGTDGYKQIGTVDPVKDGLAGAPLRVNFSAVLPNADFSGGVSGSAGSQTPTGWTVNRNYVALGSLASKSQGRAVTKSGSGPYTISGPGYSFQTDSDYDPASHSQWGYESKQRGVTTATYGSDVVAYGGHDESLRLYFDGQCPSPNDTSFCSAFGPEAYSSPFQAKAGDALAFDWAAANGSDNYEVYGFLVNQDTSATTELMYGRGGLAGWSTTSGTIPADGTYRFRFVSGSYDMTGGFAIGASLYIDNVRVLSNDASAAVAQAVTRMVQYENTSDNPPTTRTIDVETSTAGGNPATSTVPTEITPVDDAPTIGTIATSTFTNTMANDTFATATGTIPGTDPEGDTITYGLTGATTGSTVVGGVTYDLSLAGTYGTAYVRSTTGAWAYVPDAAAINARLTGDTESFALTATANGLVGSGTLPIAISVPASVPGAPTSLGATAANASVDLSWSAPVWLGGSAITGYRIEMSDDGSTWTTAVADTASAATTATVSSLTNGTSYRFRVSARNATGQGAASNVATATPVTVPGAPTAVAATPADRQATVTWTAPGDDGGTPVTGYRVETTTDGGTTWTVALADTASTATSAVLGGLTNGTTTGFRVSAINAVGVGGPSAPTTTVPRTVPGSPTSVVLTPGNGWVVANWTAPSDDGGSPLTSYRVETSTDGGTTWSTVIADSGTTDTSAFVPALANGTPVKVRVSAINVAGVGQPSTPATTTPRTLPGAPTITSITPGNRQLTVAVTAPASDGGAPITNYEYSTDGGHTWTAAVPATTAGPIVIGRLDNDVAVTVLVRAVNAAGSGPASTGKVATPHAEPVVPPGVTQPPVSSNGGRLLADGVEQSLAIVDTSTVPGDRSPEGTVRASGAGISVDLLGRDSDGAALPLDDGRLQVVSGATVDVHGEGYRPGSTVDIWLMPGSHLLGTLTAGPDGSVSGQLAIPAGLQSGDHTIQLNGVGPDGITRTLTLAVAVLDATARNTSSGGLLALTGAANTQLLLLAGASFILSGLEIQRRRRRIARR